MKYLLSVLYFIFSFLHLTGQSEKVIDYELQNLIRLKDEIPEGNSNTIKVTLSGLKIVGGQGNVCIFALKKRVALISYANITGGSQNAFNDNVVLCPLDSITLVADKDGLGWINNNDFSSDRIELPQKIAGKDIWHMVAVGKEDALLLIGGKLYLSQYNKFKIELIAIKESPHLTAIEKINDTLIIGINDKQAYQILFQGKGQIRYRILEKIKPGSQDTFIKLFAANDKQFVIQTNKGFCKVYECSKYSQFQLLRRLHVPQTGLVVRAVKLLEGNYFIATLYDGLYGYYKSDNYREARPISLKTSSGKPLRQILSLELTDDNALLIGTRGGGLLEYSPIRSATFTPFFPKIDSFREYHDFSIRSIDEFGNLVYFGTDEGQVYSLDINTPKALPVNLNLKFNLKNIQIRSLHVTKKYLYIGTGVDVAWVYKFKRDSPYSLLDSVDLKARQVSAIFEKEGFLYIGTNEQLIKIKVKSKLVETIKPEEVLIDGESIKNIVEDKKGNVFALSAGGKIFILLPKAGVSYKELKIISDSSDKTIKLGKDLLHLTEDDQGYYYLFTRGDFIWKSRFDSISKTMNVIEKYDYENGLLSDDKSYADVVYGGFVDKAGTLWCSTDKGIYCKKAGKNFFYRLTPEVLGLPDNPDGNTGAYSKVNDSTLIFGFRQGGVIIHSEKFNNSKAFSSKIFVLEQLDDGKFRMIQNKHSVSKNENFSVINLIPYSIDNNYSGAEPVEIESYTNGDDISKKYFSLSGLGFSIFPKDFNYKLDLVYWGENTYSFKAINHIEIRTIFHETRKFLSLLVVLIAIISLGVGIRYYKVYKIKEDKRIEVAEEKAKNAEREKELAIERGARQVAENDIKRDTISLAEKALGEHFLKNTLSEIRRTTALDVELDHNLLLKALFQHSGIESETAQDFLEKTAIELKKNPGNRVLVPHRLKLLCKKAINKESAAYILLSRYAEFVHMLIENKKESGEIADSVIGYYSMLVSDKTESSIKKDKELIENLFNLYTINPGHRLKDETIEITIDSLNPKFEDVKIPRLLTQPLIENARNKGDRPLGLSVIYQHLQSAGNDFVKVSVTNNGKWIENQQNSFKEEMSNRHSLDIIQDIIAKLKGEWLGHQEEPTQVNRQSTVTVSFIIPVSIN